MRIVHDNLVIFLSTSLFTQTKLNQNETINMYSFSHCVAFEQKNVAIVN